MSEALFLLVILKIPVVYLGLVVWWAIRAVPEPPVTEETVPVSDTPLISPTVWSPRPAGLRRPDRNPPQRRPVGRQVALRAPGRR
jgi:hypothetical protein